MSYGLYDGDLILYPKVPFFNLELMKLSSYYKRKREIVGFCTSFSPDKYTHFLVRQDYYNPQQYKVTNNVEFHGRAFDGEKYKPLPIEIEKMKPDRDIYTKAKKHFNTNLATTFSTMQRAEHIRLSLDGQNIWNNFEKQLTRETGNFGLILHDYNLGEVKGSLDLINDLLIDLYPTGAQARVGMKFPVILNNEEEFLKWLRLPPLNIHYSTRYNGYLSKDTYEDLREIRKKSTSIPQSELNITGNTTYEKFITKDIVEIFKEIQDLRSYRINFPLIYDKDFFKDEMWKKTIDLILFYNRHISDQLSRSERHYRIAPYETFFSYIRRCTQYWPGRSAFLNKYDCQEIFAFVREQNYELFKLFYEYVGENYNDKRGN